jgi:hypothetical protein
MNGKDSDDLVKNNQEPQLQPKQEDPENWGNILNICITKGSSVEFFSKLLINLTDESRITCKHSISGSNRKQGRGKIKDCQGNQSDQKETNDNTYCVNQENFKQKGTRTGYAKGPNAIPLETGN